jgi:hypothetical protein
LSFTKSLRPAPLSERASPLRLPRPFVEKSSPSSQLTAQTLIIVESYDRRLLQFRRAFQQRRADSQAIRARNKLIPKAHELAK